ncbi:hypothetical protein LTR17_000547 [Elasticomyces elasticus]|nr:hypothetical protein LTR17_000547 [Elasticomyces elasticus]
MPDQDQLQQTIDARISRVLAAQLNNSKLVDALIGAAIEADRAAQRSTPQMPVTTLVDHAHEVHGSTRQLVVLHATEPQVNSMPEVELPSEHRLRDPLDSRIVQTAREPRNKASNAVIASVNMSGDEIMPVTIQQRAGAGLVDRRNREQMQQRTLLYLTFGKALYDIETHIPDDYSSGVILTSTFRISQMISAAITALGALQFNDPGPVDVARKVMHDHFKSIIGFLAEHNYSIWCGVLDILIKLREGVCVALQGGIDDIVQLLREAS